MDFRAEQKAVDLCGAWRMAYEHESDNKLRQATTGREIEAAGVPVWSARVPGNFELDLLENGLIEDPFYGMNISGLTRFEQTRVAYWRTFTAEVPSDCEPVLELKGVDCYAAVYLNGVLLGRCANMLVEHRFPIPQGCLREENEILVVIEPPLRPTDEGEYPRLLQAMRANYESLRTRKAPHMYGWDGDGLQHATAFGTDNLFPHSRSWHGILPSCTALDFARAMLAHPYASRQARGRR